MIWHSVQWEQPICFRKPQGYAEEKGGRKSFLKMWGAVWSDLFLLLCGVLWLPGYPKYLLLSNESGLGIPPRRFLERKHILNFLICPRNWWVGPEPKHTWVGFDTLVRDDPKADDIVLYNTPHFDVTTNDNNDGSLRLKYGVNIEQRKNSVWVVRQPPQSHSALPTG